MVGLAVGQMWTYFVPVKTATVRELRNEFAKLETWLGEGEVIRIEKRGKVVGGLTCPDHPPATQKLKKPDFMARLRESWGGRVFSEEEVRAMRDAELEGEKG